jgi:predicted nucleic acid-binding protein
MWVALDTNILVYVEGVNGTVKKKAALQVLQRLPQSAVIVPVQALGELFHVLVRKAGRSRSKARAAVLGWQDACATVETSAAVMVTAADLATQHHLSIWDAVILSASAEAGCRLLLSGDLHDGFTWQGVTVANPFASPTHELLQGLLSGKPAT